MDSQHLISPGISVVDSRVFGWDILRGLCALAVCSYHLLTWQGIADLHSFGSYGVYLFFVLSGASLAYNYAERFAQGQFSWGQFIWIRYLRLAPLYLGLMLVVLPWKLRDGVTGELVGKLALNAFFIHGFHNPAVSSALVGGWSLGIEAIFYLLFPLMLAAAMSRFRIAILAAVVLLQVTWIEQTIGLPEGYTQHMVAYHQVPAFAAYFMGGCVLGLVRLKNRDLRIQTPVLLLCVVASFSVFLLLNGQRQGDELVGWRGAVLFSLCFFLVWVAGHVDVRLQGVKRISAHLGDATYGLYLIHPVIYFGLAFALLPKLGFVAVGDWVVGARLLLAFGIIVASFAMALLSERYFERPLREWSKSRFQKNHS